MGKIAAAITSILFAALAAAAAPGDTLKILDYNLWQWNMGVTRLEALIRAADADIAGLQEAWVVSNNEKIAANLGWSVAYGGRDAKPGKTEPFWINGYHMPQVLISAFPIAGKRYFNIVDENREGIPDATKTLRRGATLGRLEIPGHPKGLHVMVLHLNPWEPTWAVDEIGEMLGILDSLSGLPVVVMGDFNTRSHKDGATGADAQVHQRMENAGFVDVYALNGKREPGRIDFIYASRHLTPLRSLMVVEGVFGSRGDLDSDHPAVFAELRFKRGCTDAAASNHDRFAVVDDGTCKTTGLAGGPADREAPRRMLRERRGGRMAYRASARDASAVELSGRSLPR